MSKKKKKVSRASKARKQKRAKKGLIIGTTCAAIVGIGFTIGYFSSKDLRLAVKRIFEGDVEIAKVKNENLTERGYFANPDPNGEPYLPFMYLGSNEAKLEGTDKEICAHSFLIGRVSSVPFFKSGWTKFSHENTEVTLSYGKITEKSVSTSVEESQKTVESTSWKTSTSFENKLVTTAETKIGPAKLKAENTMDFKISAEFAGSTTNEWSSSHKETKTSVETLSKAADYTIKLNTENGYKKGRYYRITLQQTASVYMTVYEANNKANDKTFKAYDDIKQGGKYYDLTSFLSDPSDYKMVIEETTDPDEIVEKTPEEQFDADLYADCAEWIEKQRASADGKGYLEWLTEEEIPDMRKAVLDTYFKGAPKVEADLYTDSKEYKIIDKGPTHNHNHKLYFETLFKSKGSPHFYELFDNDLEGGYGYKFVDVQLEFYAKEVDDGYLQTFIMPYGFQDEGNAIQQWKVDLGGSWTRLTYEKKDIPEAKFRSTITPKQAEGYVNIMFDTCGHFSDDHKVKNFVMKVWIH